MNNLKKIMKAKGVSPFAAAVDTGYSISAIYRWGQDRGQPGLFAARVVADYLGVSDREIWP